MYSIIIPVYNRPEEVNELLRSLSQQSVLDFEVIVVEDGSVKDCRAVVDSWAHGLPSIHYIYIPNSGPSRARNEGVRLARGEYVIILDSDVVLPSDYLNAVSKGLERTGADAFGGPDAASADFSPMQRAISYAMTSTLTTGGIRGGCANAMERFKPRSFNMGCRRSLFEDLGGFSEDMRYGEDIDFSLRMFERGARVCLFPEAYVYHKRRASLSEFFTQVKHSGEARVALEARHPGSTKLVHYLPALFLVYTVLALLSVVGLLALKVYALLILCHASIQTGSLEVGLKAVVASFVQLWGYGYGHLSALCKR